MTAILGRFCTVKSFKKVAGVTGSCRADHIHTSSLSAIRGKEAVACCRVYLAKARLSHLSVGGLPLPLRSSTHACWGEFLGEHASFFCVLGHGKRVCLLV